MSNQTKGILGQLIKANKKIKGKIRYKRLRQQNPNGTKDAIFIIDKCTTEDVGLKKMLNWNRLTRRIIVNQLLYPPCSEIMQRFHSRSISISIEFSAKCFPNRQMKKHVKIRSRNLISKQECIPVGCVSPACCPYLPACTALGGGGVPARGYLPGEVYLPRYSPCEQND